MKRLKAILFSAIFVCTLTTEVSAQAASQNLTTANAVKIAYKASNHYWNSLHGYKSRSCSQKSFQYKGIAYSYLCPEFNTKNKLVEYLSETFTNTAIQKGLTNYKYITYKGKLARPLGDGGSMLEWRKAKAKLVYQKQNVRSYHFTVPDVEGGSVKRTVTFYKTGTGWKVNRFDAVQ
ncbi:IseA DL-endopeptidase inhibitor family protein [Peribacillus glennii]|uniref:IseA DL-endopeptidase inhibitor family protein n=1 Tax=Peribacillus glennii TaxID=2303991 RepID=A0A372LFF3_9BACI|nr:IseA DL-endopeptidase inhibitor family protein [Peribacillus glennii]RFU65035.1 hypothetical protein D0466_03735 [Peribacillus glennii]